MTSVPCTTLPRLRKTIRGDLEWITLRALQRDRTRRYQTASELAEDLRRHLTAEPVSAGPPGFGYRFGKLVQRYRGPAAVAAIVLVALLGSLLFSLSAWHTAEAAAEKEREARSETRKVLRRQLLVSLSALGTVNRWLFQDRRNELEHAAVVRAVLHVEPKHAVDAGDVRVIN